MAPDGMALDEMHKAMPPEELEEWNEKNLEGRIELSCWKFNNKRIACCGLIDNISKKIEVITDHERKKWKR